MAKTYVCPACKSGETCYCCPVCNGKGWLRKDEWREYWTRVNKPTGAYIEKCSESKRGVRW